MKVGDRVPGGQFYGKGYTHVGTVIAIEEVVHTAQPWYRGMDVITIRFDDGQVARFNRENVREGA